MLMSSSDHVRLQPARKLDRLVAVGRAADDLDPLVGREDGLERLREEAVVVGDEEADRRGHHERQRVDASLGYGA